MSQVWESTAHDEKNVSLQRSDTDLGDPQPALFRTRLVARFDKLASQLK